MFKSCNNWDVLIIKIIIYLNLKFKWLSYSTTNIIYDYIGVGVLIFFHTGNIIILFLYK